MDRDGKKTGGRKKGVPNRNTTALKDMILGALDDAGGQSYLKRQAALNPAAFMSLIGKVLPTTIKGETIITGDASRPVAIEFAWRETK